MEADNLSLTCWTCRGKWIPDLIPDMRRPIPKLMESKSQWACARGGRFHTNAQNKKTSNDYFWKTKASMRKVMDCNTMLSSLVANWSWSSVAVHPRGINSLLTQPAQETSKSQDQTPNFNSESNKIHDIVLSHGILALCFLLLSSLLCLDSWIS